MLGSAGERRRRRMCLLLGRVESRSSPASSFFSHRPPGRGCRARSTLSGFAEIEEDPRDEETGPALTSFKADYPHFDVWGPGNRGLCAEEDVITVQQHFGNVGEAIHLRQAAPLPRLHAEPWPPDHRLQGPGPPEDVQLLGVHPPGRPHGTSRLLRRHSRDHGRRRCPWALLLRRRAGRDTHDAHPGARRPEAVRDSGRPLQQPASAAAERQQQAALRCEEQEDRPRPAAALREVVLLLCRLTPAYRLKGISVRPPGAHPSDNTLKQPVIVRRPLLFCSMPRGGGAISKTLSLNQAQNKPVCGFCRRPERATDSWPDIIMCFMA